MISKRITTRLISAAFIFVACTTVVPPEEEPPPDLTSGLDLIATNSGFDFATREQVDSSRGDVVFVNNNGPRLEQGGKAFIVLVGEVHLGKLVAAPDIGDTSYQASELATPGMSYYVVTRSGSHVAKFRVSAFKYENPDDPSSERQGVLVDWVYNAGAYDTRFQ